MIKLRLPRKVVFVISGVAILGGTTGAAALFIGRDVILGPSQEDLSGVTCRDIVRVAEMRKGRGPWLRKFVKVPPGTDGITRAKTAIRVAARVQETLPADLIEIAVLDDSGPDKRAFMRGRAIGAEVILVKDPASIPGVKGKYTVRYYEGGASGTGMFYGQGENMSSAKAEQLLSKMKKLTDCTPPPGKTVANIGKLNHGEVTKAHVENASAPAESGHGEAASAEGKSGGFFSSMLSMVGFGGSSDKAGDVSTGHEAVPADAASLDGAHAAGPSTNVHGGVEKDVAGGKSFMSKMLGMMGLGGGDKPKTTIEHSGGPSIVSAKVKADNAGAAPAHPKSE